MLMCVCVCVCVTVCACMHADECVSVHSSLCVYTCISNKPSHLRDDISFGGKHRNSGHCPTGSGMKTPKLLAQADAIPRL